MPTSELSDALNPYASQSRQRQSAPVDYSPPNQTISYQTVAPPSQQYVPHVSDLELAIAEPTPAPPALPRQGVNVFAELARVVVATQNAQESERKRRLAWEQEQESKYAQRQAEMEKKMLAMSNELSLLRATMNALRSSGNTPGLATPQYNLSPALSQRATPNLQNLASPISPVSQSASQAQPMFIQGSSTNPLPPPPSVFQSEPTTNNIQPAPQPYIETTFQVNLSPLPQAMTPGPSPHLTNTDASERPSASPAPRPSKRKKKRRSVHSSDDEGTSSGSSSSTSNHQPRKRVSHHDTRCYTIQHAMRLHVLRMMDVDNDKDLPDNHDESGALGPSDPVRFVWDKTAKQSVHNSRMKKRIIDDLKENRRLYRHVPNKEFTKKVLDAAFDQCFVTFRQKYKAQKDATSASHLKQREDSKARKARHLSRRKIKLSNRSDARNNIPTFEHVTFDGAMQPDCMSSEESDIEQDPLSSQPCPVLRTRGHAWRSSRLVRFYCILDDEERLDTSSKPKRGLGKKERRVGPLKEEFTLPPQGAATWMISRRWYKASLASRPDLPNILNKLINDQPGFDWEHFHDLGEETVDEDEAVVQHQHPQQQQPQVMHNYNPPMHSMNLGIPQHQYDPNTYMNYTM
ncbi:unnamed protein product [Cyclocybe aegerita]|uniref:Uncharacterized protein n=1 Tax=Cyclocybe aegerita TaxID=1973307 RepID=A0A8S0VQE0_CYCAE|nr:unnamed protein product [Cyclocybe aegerita]